MKGFVLLLAATTCAASANSLLDMRETKESTSLSTSAPLYRRTVSSKLHLKRKVEEEAKEKEAKEGEEARLRKMVDS